GARRSPRCVPRPSTSAGCRCQSRCRRHRRGARSGQKEVDMNENEQGVSDTSEPGVGPDLGGAASTGPESGGATDGDRVTAGEGSGTSGGSGAAGTGG